uniref:Uncharacterized protein n=1 Tax=Macrostomum lignano TaxID=282301 RepID=A0A1I8I298_9PLAT
MSGTLLIMSARTPAFPYAADRRPESRVEGGVKGWVARECQAPGRRRRQEDPRQQGGVESELQGRLAKQCQAQAGRRREEDLQREARMAGCLQGRLAGDGQPPVSELCRDCRTGCGDSERAKIGRRRRYCY